MQRLAKCCSGTMGIHKDHTLLVWPGIRIPHILYRTHALDLVWFSCRQVGAIFVVDVHKQGTNGTDHGQTRYVALFLSCAWALYLWAFRLASKRPGSRPHCCSARILAGTLADILAWLYAKNAFYAQTLCAGSLTSCKTVVPR